MIFQVAIAQVINNSKEFNKELIKKTDEKDLFSSGTVGNGGDPYIDEFNEYRNMVITEILRNSEIWKARLGVNEQELQSMLEIFQATYLYRHDLLSTLTNKLGEQVNYSAMFNRPIEEILQIGGQRRSAVNVKNENLLAIIFDIEAWDKEYFKTFRKLQLVAHELFGIADLEGTTENHYSKYFTEKTLRQTAKNINGIPVVLLEAINFETEFISKNSSCQSAETTNRVSAATARICRERMKKINEEDFYSYACDFSGDIIQRTDTNWKIEEFYKRIELPLPPLNNSSILKSLHRKHHSMQTLPRFFIEKYKKITTPINTTFCKIVGQINFTGVDPNTSDLSLKVLESSKRRLKEARGYEQIAAKLENSPMLFMNRICSKARKQVRRIYYDKSYCRVFQDSENYWQWELIGVHPFKTEFKY
jgi:hypothetical protein